MIDPCRCAVLLYMPIIHESDRPDRSRSNGSTAGHRRPLYLHTSLKNAGWNGGPAGVCLRRRVRWVGEAQGGPPTCAPASPIPRIDPGERSISRMSSRLPKAEQKRSSVDTRRKAENKRSAWKHGERQRKGRRGCLWRSSRGCTAAARARRPAASGRERTRTGRPQPPQPLRNRERFICRAFYFLV